MPVDSPLKHTPLYDVHVAAGARMVPFGGWHMPVQYTSIVDEHRAVRNAVGLFDVSHMGEFEISGPRALAALQAVTTNDVAALAVGQVQYTLLCNDAGGIVDDLTIARLGDTRFMLTVNAANIAKDWAHVTTRRPGAGWQDVSEATGLIAVQGPRAEALMTSLTEPAAEVTKLGYYRCTHGIVAGVAALISRTGYTGEDGFELYVDAARAGALWHSLLDAGSAHGAVPVGLGARDTLRLEMKYALYGNDIDETTNPIEASLGWVVKEAKGDFVGRGALERVRRAGPARRLVGLEMAERAVARHGYPILQGGAPVGVVTSGSYGPSVDRCIALGYLPSAAAAIGTELAIEIRGQAKAAHVAKTPFYPSHVKK